MCMTILVDEDQFIDQHDIEELDDKLIRINGKILIKSLVKSLLYLFPTPRILTMKYLKINTDNNTYASKQIKWDVLKGHDSKKTM